MKEPGESRRWETMPFARPKFTVNEILRRYGADYSSVYKMNAQQRKVMRILSMCRTEALGGHLEICDNCCFERPVYNSCGERHCPSCQGKLARIWVKRRLDELINVHHFHCAFTVPAQLNVLAFRFPALFYDLLFKAAAAALLELTRKVYGGRPGMIGILHTWGQELWLHPHIHFIVTGGALSADRRSWTSAPTNYFLDVFELSPIFRKHLCARLRRAKFDYPGIAELIDDVEALNWNVYCEPPLAGPEKVVEYIGRYTHSVAISNWRIVDVSDSGKVTFTCKNYAKQVKDCPPPVEFRKLGAVEFIRRFMLHVLPKGFRKIRFYGILAGTERARNLEACERLLGKAPEPAVEDRTVPPGTPLPDDSPLLCPRCKSGCMQYYKELPANGRAPPVVQPYRRSRHAA
jgi:hypothetical protein